MWLVCFLTAVGSGTEVRRVRAAATAPESSAAWLGWVGGCVYPKGIQSLDRGRWDKTSEKPHSLSDSHRPTSNLNRNQNPIPKTTFPKGYNTV